MNTGYLIYQAERPLSRFEQRQADIAQAELVRAVSRGWHALTAPLRALRSAGRSIGRSAGRSIGRPARRRTGLPAGYPAAEGLTECQAGECLTESAA